MTERKIALEAARQRELRQLIDEISCGTILDIDELHEQDTELLRDYFGTEEDLDALFDRLRGGDETILS